MKPKRASRIRTILLVLLALVPLGCVVAPAYPDGPYGPRYGYYPGYYYRRGPYYHRYWYEAP